MPSFVFKRADKRYLIVAYAENTTHATMSAYESGLEFVAEGTNKIERATSTINFLFEQPNADELLMDLLTHVFVDNPYANPTSSNPTYEQLRMRVLEPRGIELTDDGFQARAAGNMKSVAPPEDVKTAAGLDKYPGLIAGIQAYSGILGDTIIGSVEEPLPPISTPSNKTVFVVHGRDTRPIDQIERFLLFLGLTMMSWSDAVKLTGETQPHTYDIVKAGMDNAAAVVVVFSPDDEARVKNTFATDDDTEKLQGQSRQNVLVEAGMAFAQSRKKTIFIQSERTRPITDLEGFNWVSLDGNWDSRKDFINRLEAAGADPKPVSENLTHRVAGEFKV